MPLSTAVFKGSGASLISKINKEMQITLQQKGAFVSLGVGPWVGQAAAPCAGKHRGREGVLFQGKQRLRAAQGSVDTKQRLCLQGYLIVNKSCQEGRNPPPPSPGTLRISCEHGRCGTGRAAWGMQKSLAQAYFYSCRSPRKHSPTLSPRLTCQGCKHPTKFPTRLKPFLLSVCFHFTCGSSRCSMGPSALL